MLVASANECSDMLGMTTRDVDVVDLRCAPREHAALTLPAELLSNIFGYCLLVCPVGCRPRCEKLHLEVTHVCRYWRAVAFEAASLWSTFRTTRCDVAAIMLERSKSSPLTIHLPFILCDPSCRTSTRPDYPHPEAATSTLRSVLSASPRVQSLDLSISRQQAPDFFHLFRQAPFPALQSLSVVSCPLSHSATRLSFLPDDIFAQIPISLQFLSLDGISLTGSSSLLRNLISLRLLHGRTGYSNFMDLCTALGSLLYLEDLYISDYSWCLDWRSTANQNSHSVHLTSLKRLTLFEHNLGPIPRILARFTAPPDAVLDIHTNTYPQSPVTLRMLGAALSTHLQRNTDMPARMGLDVAGCSTNDENAMGPMDVPISIGFWRHSEGVGRPSICMPLVCTALYLPDLFQADGARSIASFIQIFEIGGKDTGLPKEWWISTFRNLTNVHTLVLGVSATAANFLFVSTSEGDEVACLMPSLRVVVIRMTPVYPNMPTCWSKTTAVEGIQWPQTVRDFCRTRGRLGLPLDQIRVEGCPWFHAGDLLDNGTVVLTDDQPSNFHDVAHWSYVDVKK